MGATATGQTVVVSLGTRFEDAVAPMVIRD
jgi:hypothetical protein